ncbi:MAG: peptidoglycan-binding domain-containing protein [Clostridiaceae bacterium]
MNFITTRRRGDSGQDVLVAKQRLFELGCYDPSIASVSSETFGSDTRAAVRKFQRTQGLEADGIIGPLTWAALFGESTPAPVVDTGLPANISQAAAEAILRDLSSVSATRRAIVIDALQYAYDPAVPAKYPLSLYIRGGNLYNTDLQPNVITLARIASGAARQPEYYDGGRQEMMEHAVRANPSITGADCSGGVVGLLRHAQVVKAKFDLSADGFNQSSSYLKIDKADLAPADLLHKPGHLGLYAGGGYGVEWMGGAYGCQLTRVSARRGWNFVKDKLDKSGNWTDFLHPKYY